MASAQVAQSANAISDYQEFMNDTNVKSANSASANCNSTNTLSITTGRGCEFVVVGDANFNIDQTASSSCTSIAESKTDVESVVKANITDTIQQYLEQAQKNKQGFIATGLSAQVSQASNISELGTRITNKINATSDQKCDAISRSFNSSVLDLCGAYGRNLNADVRQNALAQVYQSCTMDMIISAFQEDEILRDFAQTAIQKQASEQKGLDSIFNGFFLIIAGAIVLVVLVIILILVFSGSGGKKDLKKTVSKASKAAGKGKVKI